MSVVLNFINNIKENFDVNGDIKFHDLSILSIEQIESLNPVISTDKNGKVLSKWKDEKWDFENYSLKRLKQKSYVDFSQYKGKLTKKLFNEYKLMVYLIFIEQYNNNFNAVSISSIATSIIMFFENLVILEIESICDLSEKKNLIKLMESIKGKYSQKTLSARLSILRKGELINAKALQYRLNITHKKRVINDEGFNIEYLTSKYGKEDTKNQTYFIPDGIHNKIIFNSIKYINKYFDYLENISKYIEDEYLAYEEALDFVKKEKPKLTRYELKTFIRNYRKKSEIAPSTQKLLRKHKLENVFKNNVEIQDTCRFLATSSYILLLTFSGMRNEEAMNIEIDNFKILNTEPKLYVIRSYETKISGGEVVDYITSPVVEKAFKVLEKIQYSSRKYDDSIENKKLLFVKSKHQKLFSYGDPSQMRKNMISFMEKFNITLNECDYKQNKVMNNNDLKIGDFWAIKSHQFRRTLIVNFVNHNISSMDAIKQQVKHMYLTMTEYYAKDSQLAKKLNLKQSKEIVKNIDEELLNEKVNLYKEFYYTDEHLTGEKGKDIVSQRNIADILSDEEIKVMFESGQYKLTQTPYGYCTKGDECDKSGVVDPTFCGASCSNMIITYKNALNWKKLYERNNKLFNNKDKFLIYGGLKLDGAITMMESQNQVAKRIMKEFNIEF